MRESSIELRVNQHADKLGIFRLKLVGKTGIPDQMYILKNKFLLIEFKTKSGKLTGSQLLMHNKLVLFGVTVHVVRDVETGITLLNNFYDECNQLSGISG